MPFLVATALLVAALATLLPLLWMVSASFMPPGEASAWPPHVLPSRATLDNYLALFQRLNLGRCFINSTFVAVTTTLLCLLVTSLAGYAFAKLQFKGRERTFRALLAAVQAGREDHAAALLRWLMPPVGRAAAQAAAKHIAQAVEESGRRLCCRPVGAAPVAVAMHGGARRPVRLAVSNDRGAQCASAQLGPMPESATIGASSGTAVRLASSITARTTAAVKSTCASGTSNTNSSCT